MNNPNMKNSSINKDILNQLVYTEIICYPVKIESSFDVESAKKALETACVDYRGWPFIFYLPNSRHNPQFGDNIIWALNTDPFYGRLTFYYWAFDYRRGIFYSKNMTPESSMHQPRILDPDIHAKIFGEAVIGIGRLFDSLEVPLYTNLLFCLRFKNLKGVRIASFGEKNYAIYSNHNYTDSELKIDAEKRLSDFLNSPESIATEIIFDISRRMGCDKLPTEAYFVRKVSEHLSKGQKVNY